MSTTIDQDNVSIQGDAVNASDRFLARGFEVWALNADGTKLQWTSGIYRDMRQFESISRETTFDCGEGLPGEAWQLRSPVLIHDLQAGQFKRRGAAADAGLRCALALPFFRDDELRAVVVLLFEDERVIRGGVEIWKPTERRELGLSDSYYAQLEPFSRLSRFVKFPCGGGLPGQVWKMRFPKIVGNLAASPSFFRGNGARIGKLRTGLAIPFMRAPWDLDSVVLLLSSAQTPIARAIETWIINEDETLSFHSGAYGRVAADGVAVDGVAVDGVAAAGGASHRDELERVSRTAIFRSGEGVAGTVLQDQLPRVFSDPHSLEPDRACYLQGLDTAVGLPIFIGSTLVAITTLWL
jgi:hypothetical protein